MEIIEKDFKLIPCSKDSPLFDIELLYKVKPRGGEARLEFKNAGYGLSLQSAIRKIAHYRTCCKHEDEAINLTTYFKNFKKELEEICQSINL